MLSSPENRGSLAVIPEKTCAFAKADCLGPSQEDLWKWVDMAQCEWHFFCGLEGVQDADGRSLCILHSHNPRKDKKAFEEALAQHRKKVGDNFTAIVFPTDVDFSDVKFDATVHFTAATFGGECKFFRAEFSGEGDFALAVFLGTVNFQSARFGNGAFFSSARFYGDAHFDDAQFYGKTSFSGASFGNDSVPARASFQYAKFNGTTDFWDTTFTQEANFMKARFSERVEFVLFKSVGKVSFAAAEFTGTCKFLQVQFAGGATFREASFLGQTLISSLNYADSRFLQVFSGGEIDFTDVRIYPLDVLLVRHADLRRCRFRGTDLRKAEITGEKWARRDNPFPLVSGRLVVYDEIAEPEAHNADWYSDIERLYRQLKQNYEDRRDFERAGDFHYGEKEMRRKNPETPCGRRFLLGLYWAVSGYGERCLRPLLCAALFLGLTTFCYVHWGLLILRDDHNNLVDCTKFWEVMVYGVRVMTLLKPANFEPSAIAGNLVNVAQSIVGPLLIGLFALAVRQRLKR